MENFNHLVRALKAMNNSRSCGLLAESILIRIKHRERALSLLREREDASWDLIVDLMLEVERLDELHEAANVKKEKLFQSEPKLFDRH